MLTSNQEHFSAKYSKVLFLSHQKIKVVSFENSWLELEVLDLSCNWIVDIEPLAKLTNLKVLILNDNLILNFEVLKDLKNLELLICYNNPFLYQQIQLDGLEKHLPNCNIHDGRPIEGEERSRANFYGEDIKIKWKKLYCFL